MTTWLVSRHAATIEWLREELVVDRAVEHLAIDAVESGDVVIGVLPVNLIADLCDRDVRYLHLVLDLPSEARGRELTRAELIRYGAHLQEFRATRVGDSQKLETTDDSD